MVRKNISCSKPGSVLLRPGLILFPGLGTSLLAGFFKTGDQIFMVRKAECFLLPSGFPQDDR